MKIKNYMFNRCRIIIGMVIAIAYTVIAIVRFKRREEI